MANKSKRQTNLRRQKLVNKYAAQRAELKKIIMNRELPLKERFEAQQQLTSLPRNSSGSRLRNRCEIDGRPRGYMRQFGMSRIWFRTLAGDGLIPGVEKASW